MAQRLQKDLDSTLVTRVAMGGVVLLSDWPMEHPAHWPQWVHAVDLF
jgi:hypothetical protein